MGKKTFTRIICAALAAVFLVSVAVIGSSADQAFTGNVTEQSIEDYLDTLSTISYEEYRSRNQDYFTDVPVRTGEESAISFDATKDWVFWTGGVDQFGQGKGNKVSLDSSGNWQLTDSKGNTYALSDLEAAGFKQSALVYPEEYDGVPAVYTPGVGALTWKFNLNEKGITEAGLYTITVVYYPVVAKTSTIEREFAINYEAPFTEARALTFAKRWDALLKSGNDLTTLAAIYRPSKSVQKDSAKLADALSKVKTEAEELGLTARYNSDATALLIESPDHLTEKINAFIEEYDLRFFETDDDNNELRPTAVQSPEWMSYSLRDNGGYYSEDFGFIIEPDSDGCFTLTLKGVNEPMAISKILLTPYTAVKSYDQYLADIKNNVGGEPAEGTGKVKLEAEMPSNTSTNVVYPVEDRSSALTTPCDAKRTLLNTIGTEKWETAGQWVEYRFSVDASGMYDVYSRFKQSYLDGMYVSRSLQIFTDYASKADYAADHGGNVAGYYNGLPFSEAAMLRYDYANRWQVTALTTEQTTAKEKTTYSLYFEKDVVYTLRFEVTLGSMSERVRQIESILDALNTDYLDIIKLTGSSPDAYRDYSFSSLLPETLIDLLRQSRALTALSEELKKNTASTYTGICDKLADLLDDMGHDEDKIAKNLKNMKSYVGSLGTFLTDAKTQPLQLDYIVIQGASQRPPRQAQTSSSPSAMNLPASSGASSAITTTWAREKIPNPPPP